MNGANQDITPWHSEQSAQDDVPPSPLALEIKFIPRKALAPTKATWANNPNYPPPTTPYGYPTHLHPWPGPASPPAELHTSRSHRYPNLNPALAVDSTTVRYDVRKPAHESIPQAAAVYGTYRQMPATATPVSHMRLYSSLFPWTVDIVQPTGTPITCETVWSPSTRRSSRRSSIANGACSWKTRSRGRL
jgi:hypothetical protein